MSKKRDVSLKWQDLEKRAGNDVFLSWSWIGNWLEIISGNVFLVEAVVNEQVVGLGFFVEKTRKVFGLFTIKQWHLHRAGNEKQDQIWIEHNDFLLDANISDSVREEMVRSICNFDPLVQEIIIGLSTSDVLLSCAKSFRSKSLQLRPLIDALAYRVDTKETYVDEVLSKNTRSQVIRSEKLLNRLGNLDFYVVTGTKEVQKSLESIAKLHIDRWDKTNEGSGFTNPSFKKFHHLITSDKSSAFFQLLLPK